MNRRLRALLTLPLAALFLLGGLALVQGQRDRRNAAAAYQEAEALAGLDPALSPAAQPEEEPPAELPAEEPSEEEAPPVQQPDPYADALARMDFAALRAVNPEVLGWILIPDVLSYPVMAGADNAFYLDHTWKGTYSQSGAIFLDCRNSGALEDFNTILYGHRMNNKTMFGRLDQYGDQAFRDQHPYLYLSGDGGTRTYEIFAAYEAALPSGAYQLTFHGATDRQLFLDACAEQSVLESPASPTAESRILTLSTCTGRGHDSRWVVHAVLLETDSSGA